VLIVIQQKLTEQEKILMLFVEINDFQAAMSRLLFRKVYYLFKSTKNFMNGSQNR
jgi:hypothetical protein